MRTGLLLLAALGLLQGCQKPLQPPMSMGEQLCPEWVHNRHTVRGPDGEFYPTWHPQVDPEYGCYFDHEHGDDPRTSLANPELPPFGYVGKLAGMPEAHEGFKVFVANRGVRNDEDRVALTSTRIVAHMGTGGVRRYSVRHHSLMFDLVAPSGHRVSVQGMADTGLVGSICARDPTLNDTDPSNDIGRAVMTLPGSGCHGQNPGSLYEIWTFKLRLAEKVEVVASTAVFDPITTMNPFNVNELHYTEEVFEGFQGLRGCNREAYHGPVYWYNPGGPEVFYTDAFGRAGGGLRQVVSRHSDVGIWMSQRSDGFQNQFKLSKNHCAPGLGLRN
ncbi:hypothetical protein Mlute_00977 [Meiothermus luteus]|uniref:Uncharacterized protein n=1 Tax=Meiothermus luteus TaxID=2026184 RepID=A0A399EYN4_9DEIN|nr:hypothetical protein [Meiothermus luteus]RIH87421.1 hypothetical protein Mlute_00977 [Meiothermus luteus]RMH58043.1 MAG: hypothetical protein D6684_01835 [Deinococcota bacterium]